MLNMPNWSLRREIMTDSQKTNHVYFPNLKNFGNPLFRSQQKQLIVNVSELGSWHLTPFQSELETLQGVPCCNHPTYPWNFEAGSLDDC